PMATEQEIASKKTRSKYEVVVALKNGEIQNLERMDRRQLVPGYEKVDGICHVYYILPLHFYQYSYGYVVFADEPYIMREGLLYSYMEKLQQALKLLRTNLSLDMLNQNLTKLYDKDPMTGLFNRFGYENKAIPLYQESVKSHTTMMVMFVDINYLKHINDRFGHIHGDAAIKTVADGIKEILRENWIAIRFGGDEFLIIAPNCDKREAEEVRQSILQYLEEKNNEGYRLYRISTSIGYVITDPESGHPLQEYIREADRIMYEIKRDMHAKDDGNIEAAILPDGRASMEA
ncbi:MAG: GGDEF domain-containing protein, partial [Lachnospiraceae bacterium]|nr:GGDEF domain-containing protein [Lachnospiraceae bacterium]